MDNCDQHKGVVNIVTEKDFIIIIFLCDKKMTNNILCL